MTSPQAGALLQGDSQFLSRVLLTPLACETTAMDVGRGSSHSTPWLPQPPGENLGQLQSWAPSSQGMGVTFPVA